MNVNVICEFEDAREAQQAPQAMGAGSSTRKASVRRTDSSVKAAMARISRVRGEELNAEKTILLRRFIE